MDGSAVKAYILKTFPEAETTRAYGFDMFFYKSDRQVSFATLIASDYDYGHVSGLSRPGVFRLNIQVSPQTFQSLFGAVAVDISHYDFTALDVIMPHPEYAQYHVICVLSPSEETFKSIRPLLAEAYEIASGRYLRQHQDN